MENARPEDLRLPELVTDEVAEEIHPALKKFRPPDIGIIAGGDEWSVFFAHPKITNGAPNEVYNELMLHFPKDLNDPSVGAYSVDARKRLDGEDEIIRIPVEVYTTLNPGASLWVELPF